MKILILSFLLTMLHITAGATSVDTLPPQDSLKFAYGDLSDLYEYARKGYYLAKIDTINNVYIISLEKEVKGLRINTEKLELIIDKDTELIENLFRVVRNRQAESDKQKAEIKDLKDIVKRLRRDKLEAIITGGVTIAILTLVNIIK